MVPVGTKSNVPFSEQIVLNNIFTVQHTKFNEINLQSHNKLFTSTIFTAVHATVRILKAVSF